VGWRHAEVSGPLAVEEEWVGLACAEPAAIAPFYCGFLVPQIGRALFALHGASFLDLRLISLVATAWSLVLLTRIAGHFAGPVAGLCAAGFFGASYGVGEARFGLAGGPSLALVGLLQGVQLALAGMPRLGLGCAMLLCGLAVDRAGPQLGAGEWLLAVAAALPCLLALALLGVVAL